MRSFANLAESEERVTYTPTTHRISKAKKGKPVHGCAVCSKIFTRAEHLRRHQMNHSTEARFRCEVMGCNKEFKRADLLKRHHERHDETQATGSVACVSADNSRRGSSVFSVGEIVDGRRPSRAFSISSMGSIQGSPIMYDPQMLSASNHVPMPFLHNTVEPPTPNGQLPASMQTLNSSLLSPLCIPTSSASLPGGYVPDLSYGPSDESPLHSSASSCYSTDFSHSRHIPTQTYGIPARARSGSTMSAPESSYWIPKARPSASEDSLGGWSLEETLPSQPAPYLVTGGGSGVYDSAFLPSVGTPPPRERSLGRTQSFSAFPSPTHPVPLTRPQQHVSAAAGSVVDLRDLMIGKIDALPEGKDCAGSVMEGVEQDIELYWRHFDPLVPIVHRASFSVRTSEPILVAIMCAIGAQQARTAEARQLAVAVHQRCREALSKHGIITTRSPLPDIQCIILLEYFGKLRSKRMDIAVTAQFRSLYSSLFEDRNRRNTDPLTRLRAHTSSMTDPDLRYEWLRWIDLEARRRLLLACFTLDATLALLFEKDFVQSPATRGHSSLSVSCSSAIWEAASPSAWTSHHDRLTNLLPQRRLPDLARDFLTPVVSRPGAGDANKTPPPPMTYSLFEAATVLAYIMSATQTPDCISTIESRLPHWLARVTTIFPATNPLLATYHAFALSLHTPLQDLFSVTGESWALGRKLLEDDAWTRAKLAIHRWATAQGQDASIRRAAWHAACVLRAHLAPEQPGPTLMGIPASGLHAPWCIYLSTLVCWAWSDAQQRLQQQLLKQHEQQQQRPEHHVPSGMIAAHVPLSLHTSSPFPIPIRTASLSSTATATTRSRSRSTVPSIHTPLPPPTNEFNHAWRFLYAMDTSSWEDPRMGLDIGGTPTGTRGLLRWVCRWLSGSHCGLLKEGESVLRRLDTGAVCV